MMRENDFSLRSKLILLLDRKKPNPCRDSLEFFFLLLVYSYLNIVAVWLSLLISRLVQCSDILKVAGLIPGCITSHGMRVNDVLDLCEKSCVKWILHLAVGSGYRIIIWPWMSLAEYKSGYVS